MWVNHGSAISTYRLMLSHFCLTLCNPMDYSPSGSSVHGGSTGKNNGVGCHALLQGIFPEIKSASPASATLQADWAITASYRSSPSSLTGLCFFLVLASTNTTGKHSCIPVITNLELFSPQERFPRVRFKDQKLYIHQMVNAARSSPNGHQNPLLPSCHETTL